jgi:hypothetical protein
MNDDKLKELWQRQPLREPDLSVEKLASAMQKKTSGLRQCLDARDLRELVACALVIIIFGIFYFTVYREPISRLGDLIVIGGTIFIAWKLVYARRTTPPAPPGATILESLRAELNSVRTQSRLLGSVLWWYLLPLTIGEVVATWGLPINLHAKIPSTLLFIAINAFIYWLNQRARSKQLLPLEAQLESLIYSAETGEPLDETQVTNLRPIALSMAAAEHVKPAEFKVAFWQIAFFGLPGIVGIWFFWMLSLSMDSEAWLFGIPAREKFAQTAPVEETNRYSVVARQLIDRVNTGDFTAMQKLFNPQMSRSLPPKKASDFFNRLTVRFGNIEKVEGPIASSGGWTVFGLHCQHAELTLLVALDANDRICGLYFKPDVKRSANIGLFVGRLFSRQHLLWFVPFFLGGLLYSWLIQKLTRRAVGISNLGIHLNKGLNLILWDEIKEVRPFRFLHVRNLWLIRQSGEKTLMHWTPLERHSDVKAAVETSAPPSHPIRNHLSLLTRI